MRLLRRTSTVAFGLVLLASSSPPAAGAQAQATCTRYAALSGSDAASGTESDPFATVARLLEATGPGETGCLFAGTYVEDVKMTAPGSPDAPVVLTSRPGARATIRGRFWIPEETTDVVIADLNLDGRNAGGLPSPTVNGDRIVFRANEVTNYHTGICFVLGSSTGWGVARDIVLERNRIHDCGRLPATNSDHGVYVESSRDVRILDNVIHGNADRGIQLYPDAQNTLVAHNAIDGNGEGVLFSGDGGLASSGNRVAYNIITNATIRFNVESWWPPGNPVGTGNVVERNCLWNGRQGNIALQVGFLARDNVVGDPRFLDRAAGDFTLEEGSACAGVGPRGVAPAAGLPVVAPRTLVAPRILGRPVRGSLLRIDPGSWSGSGPLGFAYAWRRCDVRGARCQTIPRGEGIAYRLRSVDVGRTIRAVVVARNAAGARQAVVRPTGRVRR